MRHFILLCTTIALVATTSHAIRNNRDYAVWGDAYVVTDTAKAHSGDADTLIMGGATVSPDTTYLPATLAAAATAICSVDIRGVTLPFIRVRVAYSTIPDAVSPTHDTVATVFIRPWDGSSSAGSWHDDILDEERRIRVDSIAYPYPGWWAGEKLIHRAAFVEGYMLIYIKNLEGAAIDSPRVTVGSTAVQF